MAFRHRLCVDLDGTLIKYDGWRGEHHFGDPIPGAVEFTKKLALIGEVVIYTARCRDGKHMAEVTAHLKQHGFYFDSVY
ncbi:MAG: hypothetical protein D0530_10925, partial [Methylococcales bacterium]